MRVLLDENLPLDLVPELVGHEVETVISRGWAGVQNSERMRRAGGLFDAFVTMDRNIEFQQNIQALRALAPVLRQQRRAATKRRSA